MRLAILFASLIIAAAPAGAAVKLSPKELVKGYRAECVSNMKALKKQLTGDKVMVSGTKDMAAKSRQLFCSFEAANPTVRQLNDKAWLKAQDTFIAKQGVKAYVLSTQSLMAQRVAQSQVHQILAKARKQGLTPAEIAFLGQITRAIAFAEAHVLAATVANK